MNSPSGQNRTLLVIDDDQDIREIFKLVLESEGYEVVTAVNGKHGLEILRETPAPSLVLLDMMMPVMNGEEFLEAYRKDLRLRSIPIVVVSASSDIKCARMADALIRKPVTLDHLLNSVANHLSH